MNGTQLSTVLEQQYPTIGKAYAILDGVLVFSLWIDRATGLPSAVPQPTLEQCESWIASLPATPDYVGFLKWIRVGLTLAQIHDLDKLYGEFYAYCKLEDADGMTWCLTDAKANHPTVMTPTLYALFQSAVQTYHLPVVLL